MSKMIINSETITNIANAIREKNGETELYLPSEMSQKILDITTGTSGEGKQPNAEFAYSRGDTEKINNFVEICEDYAFNCNNLFKTTYSHQLDEKNVTITSASYMFDFITSVSETTSLDLSGFDLSQCTDMSNMFRSSNGISEIIGIEDWDVHNVNTLDYAFYYCYNIKKFDLSKWNLSKCEKFYNVFTGCNLMGTLILPDLPSVTSFHLFSSVGSSTKLCNITFSNNGTFGNNSVTESLTLDLCQIWTNSSTSNVTRYTNLANSIGNNTSGLTRNIKLNTNLYNGLTDEQKAILTDKGYTITYGTS